VLYLFLFSTPPSHSPLVFFWTSCTASPAQWEFSKFSKCPHRIHRWCTYVYDGIGMYSLLHLDYYSISFSNLNLMGLFSKGDVQSNRPLFKEWCTSLFTYGGMYVAKLCTQYRRWIHVRCRYTRLRGVKIYVHIYLYIFFCTKIYVHTRCRHTRLQGVKNYVHIYIYMYILVHKFMHILKRWRHVRCEVMHIYRKSRVHI